MRYLAASVILMFATLINLFRSGCPHSNEGWPRRDKQGRDWVTCWQCGQRRRITLFTSQPQPASPAHELPAAPATRST